MFLHPRLRLWSVRSKMVKISGIGNQPLAKRNLLLVAARKKSQFLDFNPGVRDAQIVIQVDRRGPGPAVGPIKIGNFWRNLVANLGVRWRYLVVPGSVSKNPPFLGGVLWGKRGSRLKRARGGGGETQGLRGKPFVAGKWESGPKGF